MLGAIAGILMNLEFPIPFLAPSFYQLDFSEVPVINKVIGTFVPLYLCCIPRESVRSVF